MKENIVDQFRTNNKPLATTAEEQWKDYAERGLSAVEIARRVFRSERFSDIYFVAKASKRANDVEVQDMEQSAGFKSLVKKIEAVINA